MHQQQYRVCVRYTHLQDKQMQDYVWPKILNFEEPLAGIKTDGQTFNFYTKKYKTDLKPPKGTYAINYQIQPEQKVWKVIVKHYHQALTYIELRDRSNNLILKVG